MNYSKIVENLMLPAILAIAGFGVSFLGTMSGNIQKLTISVQELNGRMENIGTQIIYVKETLKDHEERLRHAERR